MQGKGNLTLTGHLGDVMRESAQIAYSYVRAQAPELGVDPELFNLQTFTCTSLPGLFLRMAPPLVSPWSRPWRVS